MLFRQQSAWEQYRFYFVGGAALVLLQTSFIAALLVQGRKRRRAETALRESEERFRLMADTAPGPDLASRNRQAARLLQSSLVGVHGPHLQARNWAMVGRRACILTTWGGACPLTRPRSTPAAPSAWSTASARADGEYRWLLESGVPRLGPDGTFAGYIGSCVDIADRRQAEDDADRERTPVAAPGRPTDRRSGGGPRPHRPGSARRHQPATRRPGLGAQCREAARRVGSRSRPGRRSRVASGSDDRPGRGCSPPFTRSASQRARPLGPGRGDLHALPPAATSPGIFP